MTSITTFITLVLVCISVVEPNPLKPREADSKEDCEHHHYHHHHCWRKSSSAPNRTTVTKSTSTTHYAGSTTLIPQESTTKSIVTDRTTESVTVQTEHVSSGTSELSPTSDESDQSTSDVVSVHTTVSSEQSVETSVPSIPTARTTESAAVQTTVSEHAETSMVPGQTTAGAYSSQSTFNAETSAVPSTNSTAVQTTKSEHISSVTPTGFPRPTTTPEGRSQTPANAVTVSSEQSAETSKISTTAKSFSTESIFWSTEAKSTQIPCNFDCTDKPNGDYANPLNSCSSIFYMCSNHLCYEFSCPLPLVYNATINQCDYTSDMAACQNGILIL